MQNPLYLARTVCNNSSLRTEPRILTVCMLGGQLSRWGQQRISGILNILASFGRKVMSAFSLRGFEGLAWRVYTQFCPAMGL